MDRATPFFCRKSVVRVSVRRVFVWMSWRNAGRTASENSPYTDGSGGTVMGDRQPGGTSGNPGGRRARARTAQEQELVRRQFLECARRVHARDGASGLTMRRLAAEAGYSPGAIYLYFPSRQELLRELWAEDLQGLLAAMQAAMEAPGVRGQAPGARLMALFQAYAAFWWQRQDPFRALFLEADHQFVQDRVAFAADPVVIQVNTFITGQVRAVMAEATGQADADVPEEQVNVTAHGLLAAVNGVISLHIGNGGFPWADRGAMIDYVLTALTAGLSAHGVRGVSARP